MKRTWLNLVPAAFGVWLGACADVSEAPAADGGAPSSPPVSNYDAGPSSPGYTPGYTPYDAGTPPLSQPAVPVGDSGTPSTPSNPPAAPRDAGSPLGEFDFGSLLGDGGLTPPQQPPAPTGNSGKGELDPNGQVNPALPPKKDNPPECPSLAPPNPAGNCLGLPIYVLCGYGKEGGQQYSCTCDWYHWLCV
jgi:hypothetical protein